MIFLSLASVSRKTWPVNKWCHISISDLNAWNRKLFNSHIDLIFLSHPYNPCWPLEFYSIEGGASDILTGFQFKCSARRIKVFVFVIIIRTTLMVPKFMVKKKPVSRNIVQNDWRAHIIHYCVQINCIVLPTGIKI